MDDKELISGLIKGENEAFAELFFRYEKYVFAVAKRLVKIDQDAEEITQDVFFRVIKSVEGFRGESKLSSWLYRITHNLSLNRLRDGKKERENTVGLPETAADSGVSPEKEYERKRAAEAVGSLPKKYRQILELYYYEGKSYKQIAKELEIPINTVKTNISRAKKMAQKNLGY